MAKQLIRWSPKTVTTSSWGGSPPTKSSSTKVTNERSSYIALSEPKNRGNFTDPTPMYYAYDEWKVLQGSVKFTETPWTPFSRVTEVDGIYTPDPLGGMLTPEFDTQVRNRALSNLNEKVRGSLNLSIDAAEAKSTARMFNVLQTLSDFGRHLIAVKRAGKTMWFRPPRRFPNKEFLAGKFHRIEKEWRNPIRSGSNIAADIQLSWALGWAPLLGTLHSALGEVLNVESRDVIRIKARARDTRAPEGLGYTDWVSISQYGSSQRPLRSNRSLYFSAEYEITLSKGRNLAGDLARWASLNPLSIGYELVPLSFVADYFWNLGSYINNMEVAYMYDAAFMSGRLTQVAEERRRVDGLGTPPKGEYSNAITGTLRGYRKKGNIKREVLKSYPLPSLPTLSVPRGSSQLFNLAALLRKAL